MRRIFLFGALLAALGNVATAEPLAETSPWFLEASAGLSIIPGGDFVYKGLEYEATYKNGPLLLLGFGRRWSAQWSTKLEWFYRSNKVDQLVAPGVTLTEGDLASNSFFLSHNYHLPVKWHWFGIGAYAGLGLGWMQETDYDLPGLGEFSNGGELAFQWLVGLERRLGSAGRLFLEGRAIAGGEQQLDRTDGPDSLKVDYDAWSLMLGLGWSF